MNKLFTKALIKGKQKYGVALITEIKKASPSDSGLARMTGNSFNVVYQANMYESSGAAAISVLTEANRFNGSLEDLKVVSTAVSIPTLRKDFITQMHQIDEAKQCGAAAVLLIVRILSDEQLRELYTYATTIRLEVLVETHTAQEIKRAVVIGATIIGVNARNLETLEIDKMIFEKLLPLIPKSCIKVAESGIQTRKDVEYAIACGADVVLVGSALMSSQNPRDKIRELMSC